MTSPANPSERTPATVIPVSVAPRGARLTRYALWQLRDFFIERGIGLFIIGALLGYLTISSELPRLHANLAVLPPKLIAKWGGMAGATAMMMKDFNQMFLRNFLGGMVFVGGLFAMTGLVANDRRLGYYRFLFTKPVAPWRYYGQAFVVNTLGFVTVITLLGALYGALVWPILSGRLLLVVTLMFLMYAGITFLLSVAARWDWLSLVTVAVASTFFWERFKDSPSLLAKLVYVLPPLHRTNEVYKALAQAESLPWPLIEWYAGYGLVCFIGGLLVLRYRRLAIV